MNIDDATAMRVKERAAANGTSVIVCITDDINHRVDFLVWGSDGNTIYTVSEHSATDYTCTCLAGQNDRPCKHIGAVLLFGYYAPQMHII